MNGLEQPLFSIVVPAFNEAAELPATLAALRTALAGLPDAAEVIVVDNNSSDQTGEVALAHGADRVVFEPINQIARARNAGAAVAAGDYLIFVDADTRISAELLVKTREHLQRGDVGGGAIIRFEGAISGVGRFGIALWERISRLTRTAAGSYLFCTREAFQAVGGFDETLYAGEELSLSRRLRRWGRAQGRRFEIVDTPPARTSARKLEWYSGPRIIGWMLFLTIFPFAVRWRRLCGFWYERPG